MTAAFQHRTTGPAHLSGSRFASCRRAPRFRNTCPAKRVAGQKTAPRDFFRAAPKTRLAPLSQVTETHQESCSYRYVFVSGCVVAPNSADGMPGDALKALVLSGPQYASTDGATAGTGGRTKVAYVIRVNPSANPKATDSNSKVYKNAIENLNLSFQANDVISQKWQLQFGMANSPNDLKAFVPIAEGAHALIVFVLHGDPGSSTSKNAFGEMASYRDLMDRWNQASGVNYLNTSTCIFISCDEEVGARPPSWQTENRIAPVLLNYFKGP